MAENANLMAIGKHCSVDTCKQLDFLPFECTLCKEIFCLEHRTMMSHKCPYVHINDIHVPICPMCGEIVKKGRNETTDQQVNYHIQSGCKELVVSQKPKKQNRCSLKGCKRHEVMPFNCDQCHRQFCVRHRHAQDHLCHSFTLRPVVTCA